MNTPLRIVTGTISVALRLVSFAVRFHIIPAVLGIWYIYNKFYDLWFKHVGAGRWEPAWPVARTRIALMLVIIPTWAAGMTLGLVLVKVIELLCAWGCSTRRRNLPCRDDIGLTAKPEEQEELRALEDGERRNRGREDDAEWVDVSDDRGLRKPARNDWVLVGWGRLAFYVGLLFASGLCLATYEYPKDVRFRSVVNQAAKHPRSSGYGKGGTYFLIH